MLFQHGRHIIVQVILLINIVPQPQANIPQVISLCYVGPDKSRYQRFSVRKVFLRNFTKFTGKHLCQSLFFNKVAGFRPATLLKKSLWQRCFLLNFAIFLRINNFWATASVVCLLKCMFFKNLNYINLLTEQVCLVQIISKTILAFNFYYFLLVTRAMSNGSTRTRSYY